MSLPFYSNSWQLEAVQFPRISYQPLSVQCRGSTRHFLVQIIWVKSESNLICLSQIWVKKAPQNARIRDISCFATKARCCSIRAWRKRIAIIPFLPYLAVTCFIPWKDWSLFQGHLYFKTKEYSLFLAKLTLLANDSDCLPKVCYLNLKKLRYLSKLR